MRTIKILMPVITTALFFLQACNKANFDQCDPSIKAVIAYKAEIAAGDTLKLSVSGIDNVYMYNWYGPNKFSSHDVNPQVPVITSASAGRYGVDVITNDGCIYSATTDSIKIGAMQLPCTLTNNVGEYSNMSSDSYTYVSGYKPYYGNFEVSASSSGGDIDMEFWNGDRPVTGVYNMLPWGGSMAANEVRMSIVKSSWRWSPNGGKLYVNATPSGSLIMSFCNVEFSANGYKTKVNCQITVPK